MEIASCYLEGNADAVEFCPHEPFHHILAAATYTLQEKAGAESHRAGSISLFACSSSSDVDAASNTGLQLLCCEETPGIFDIKWNPVKDHPLLALADADGCLTVRKLQTDVGNEVEGNLNFIIKNIAIFYNQTSF